MTLIKANKNIIAAFAFFCILSIVLVHKLSIPQEFVEIQVVQGDTLTQLAEQYSGKQSMDQWIREVAELNNLNDSAIIAGEDIKLPLHSNLKLDDTRFVLAEERK